MLLKKTKLIIKISLLLTIVAGAGDYIVNKSRIGIVKALVDNTIHGLIASISWLMIILSGSNHHNLAAVLLEIMLSGFMSSLIDCDHFVMAKSLNLYNATHLHGRPFLHCSTILFIPLLLYCCSLSGKLEWLHTLSWMCLISIATHHVRDGIRRGLWFCPMGDTPLIPYLAYLLFLTVLPLLITSYSKYVRSIMPLHMRKDFGDAMII